MKKEIILSAVLCLLFFSCGKSLKDEPRTKILLDSEWLFHRGNLAEAQSIKFDISAWCTIDLPHDWSIEDIPGTNSPFNSSAISGINGGFTEGGTGWYRKNIYIPKSMKDKNIELLFEGSYMNTDVWINEHYLGNQPYGYTPFLYDITSFLKYDEDNTIAVQVKNEGKNSRWYSGSGLYRHVWLTVTNPVHVLTDGTYITTPFVSKKKAEIVIETSVINNYSEDKNITIETIIFDKRKNKISSMKTDKHITGKEVNIFNQRTEIKNPLLWSPDSPQLYEVLTKVYADGKQQDEYKSVFGIREISIDAKNGFVLNGKNMKLKGGCVHHDNGPLGAKAYNRAEERRVEILKSNGFNAVRVAHNPPSVAFLDACDRLGLLVIDEAFDMWEDAKNPQDYHLYYKDYWKKDVEAMIKRDCNHPSVIMWSIGNEIPAMFWEPVVNNARIMTEFIHKMEPTRLVTAGMNELGEHLNDFANTIDVCGYNYAVGGYPKEKYASDIRNHPKRIMYGSESYALDEFEAWEDVLKNPAVIGDFVWTAIDYIGEASIGWHGYPQSDDVYPWSLAYCGDIDICGWKRPQSYYRDAFWSDEEPVISLFVHAPVPSFDSLKRERIGWSRWHYEDVVDNWNWPGYENKMFSVDVYSSCDSIELFLNGESLGVKKTDRENKNKTTYSISYSPGELKAVGYSKKNNVSSSLQTYSQAKEIKLSADRDVIFADNQDLSYITVKLIDENGLTDWNADNLIQFSVEGPASIIGVGNANPVSLESYTLPQRKAWRGKCLVILKSGDVAGKIILSASSENLKGNSIHLKSTLKK